MHNFVYNLHGPEKFLASPEWDVDLGGLYEEENPQPLIEEDDNREDPIVQNMIAASTVYRIMGVNEALPAPFLGLNLDHNTEQNA